MESFNVLLFLILRLHHASSHPVVSTFQQLVCQQCNSWCTQERNWAVPEGPQRIGKAGPKGDVGQQGQIGQPGHVGPRGPIGLPGPVGPRGSGGIVNATQIRETIDQKFERSMTAIEDMVDRKIVEVSTPGSCRNFSLESAISRNDTGGVFDINIPGLGQKEVFCDATTDGGAWIVFQRRMDGSVDFYRDWYDYVFGFGKTTGEFWLGLEAIHQLTKSGQHELRIDLIDTNGNRYYAKYSSFRVGPASDNYRLNVGGYTGETRDSLNYQNNMKFTTRDQDNDRRSANCAAQYHGAWWYNDCHRSNLNGQYSVTSVKGMYWSGTGTSYMRFTEMKVRQIQ